MRGNHIPSFLTFFSYIQPFLKEEVQVKFADESLLNLPVRTIRISKNLYRGYICGTCANCCKGYINFYSRYHAELLKERANYRVWINDKAYRFFTEIHVDKQCPHLIDNKCNIHLHNPIHCMFPPLRFIPGKNESVYITKEKFRRNLGKICTAEMWMPLTDEMFEWDLYRFNFLRKVLLADFTEIVDMKKFDDVYEKIVKKEYDIE